MNKPKKAVKSRGFLNKILSKILGRKKTAKMRPPAPKTRPLARGATSLSTKDLLAKLEDYPPRPKQAPAIVISAPKKMTPSKPVAKPARPILKRPAAPPPKRWAVKKIVAPAKKKAEKRPAAKLPAPAAKKRAAKPARKPRTKKAKPAKKLRTKKAKPAKKPRTKKAKPAKKPRTKKAKPVKKPKKRKRSKKAGGKKRKAVKKGREKVPKKIAKALRESAVSKSKIARMVKSRGPGWHGESIRHHKAALKSWETRRKKQLKYLEKKEKKKGLTKAETRKKKDLGREVVKLSKAISGLEGHLKEIEKYKNSEKAHTLSVKAVREAGKVAKRTAEAATAISKSVARDSGPPVKITLGAIEKAELVGNTDEEIGLYKKLIKRTEYDFFKRIINEPDYKERLSDYRNKLAELEERKKIAAKRPKRKARRVSDGVLSRKARALANSALKNAEMQKLASGGKVVQEPVQAAHGETVSSEAILQMPEGATPARARPRMPVQVAPAKATRRRPRRHAPKRAGRAARTAKKPVPLTPKAINVLKKGTPPEVTDERVAEIEGHIGGLMKKYSIPAAGTEKSSLNKDRIIQDFDKLINIIELEKKAKKFVEEKPAETSRIEIPRVERKKEEIRAIAKEIKKYRIITDFDRVLSYVREKGKVSESQARKDLKMTAKQFKECRNILDKSELIKVIYPPIGGVQIADVNYKGKKKKNKKKKVKS